jgi:hypothetical protein
MRAAVRLSTGSLVLVLVLAFAGAPGAAGQASGDDAGDRDGDELIVLTGRAAVADGETLDFVFIADGPVEIDGTVEGGVVALHGDVLVRGEVEEEVVAFDGRVVVDGGEVGGDVVARRRPVVRGGGTIGGSWERWNPAAWRDGIAIAGRIIVWVAFSVSALVLGMLLLLLAPRAAEAVHRASRENAGAAVGWGLLLTIGLPIAAIAAVFTIVALPLGLGVLLALGLLYGIGYVAGCLLLGRLVAAQASLPVAFLAGWAILRVVGIVPLLGDLVGFVAVAFGLGAIAVAAARARRGRADVTGPVTPAPTPYQGAVPT